MKEKIILFGTGKMGLEYLKILNNLDFECIVVGRDGKKADEIAKQFEFVGYGNGSQTLNLFDKKSIKYAIVATTIESTKDVTISCIKHGIQNILVEKPGSKNINELNEILNEKKDNQKIIFAHNRRSYNSVMMLKENIKKDGGPLGAFFDFTEREKDLLQSNRNLEIIKIQGLGNSIHVIDTAFDIIGNPIDLIPKIEGHLDCHPSGTIFVGCGKTKNCLFSYFATWTGGGRWSIEVSTKEGRYKLSPIEELHFCKKNQFNWIQIQNEDSDDKNYKPGLYKLVMQFLEQKDYNLKMPNL